MSARLAPIVLLASGCASAGDFPFDYDAPEGPLAVGVTELTLTDAGRDEPFRAGEQPRRFTVTVWYPAEPVGDEPLRPYLGEHGVDDLEEARRLAGLPRGAFDGLDGLASHSLEEAPVAEGRWPVLLFGHGYFAGIPELYGSTTEELASHGYVVVGLNRPFEAASTRFDDGEHVSGRSWRYLRAISQMLGLPKLSELEAGPEKAERTEKARGKTKLMNESLAVWVEDLRATLDVLEDADVGGARGLELLEGRLDLERIGAFGHSFGGASAVAAAAVDARIDASVNWDGFQFGEAGDPLPDTPVLLLESGQLPGVNEMIYADLPHFEQDVVAGLQHLGMSDLARLLDLPDKDQEKLVGDRRAPEHLWTTTALTRDFFDRQLGAPLHGDGSVTDAGGTWGDRDAAAR